MMWETVGTRAHPGEQMTSDGTAETPYVVISADTHGGANIADYKPYLESSLHNAFDEWAASFDNPYDDLTGDEASRNWDSQRRLTDMEADGVVAEVVFPNTIPPFFPKVSLVNQAPGASDGDLQRRFAGLRAHNRWLVDYCGDAPGRRAGIIQIMLHDLPGSIAEIEAAAAAGLTGGVLLPGAAPDSGLPPFYDPYYQPLWAACEQYGMPINIHSGSHSPDYGDHPAAMVMFLCEVTWWAHRNLWHLIFGGVMEQFPDLKFVFTEQGTEWLPDELTRLGHYHARMSNASGGGTQEAKFGAEAMKALSLTPREYFDRQCWLGSSFIRRHEVHMRDQVGVDKIMWGSDYPHLEGCWPFCHEHYRLAFAGAPEADTRAMLGENAATVYGFDLDHLATFAAQHGPLPSAVGTRLADEDIPDEALRCPAFAIQRFMPRPEPEEMAS